MQVRTVSVLTCAVTVLLEKVVLCWGRLSRKQIQNMRTWLFWVDKQCMSVVSLQSFRESVSAPVSSAK